MANFDENTWYQLNVAGSDQSMAGTGLYDQGKGAVFFAITNTSDGQQQWQLFPFNSSCYVLRTAESGQFGYLATGASTDESTPGETVPEMRNVTLSDNSMFWAISPWGDGTFYLTNAANGTEWHLNVKSNSLMSMSSNITAPQLGQRFSFSQKGSINDASFSSVSIPSTASTSTSTPATSTSLPASSKSVPAAPTSPSRSGLSSGIKAGIGAGVAVMAFLVLLALGFWLLRRRKRHPQYTPDSPLNSDYSNDRKPKEPSELQGLGRYSRSNLDGSGQAQELDPATTALYEMEVGQERKRKGREVSPYRPGLDREQKAVMPQNFMTQNIAHEMDAQQGPTERFGLLGEDPLDDR